MLHRFARININICDEEWNSINTASSFHQQRQIVWNRFWRSKIENDAFQDLNNLLYINWSLNKLKFLKDRAFAFLLGDRNHLNYVSTRLMKRISVEFVMIFNPWWCACLQKIENHSNWEVIETNLLSTNTSRLWEFVPKCVQPLTSRNYCHEMYDEESANYFYKQLIPTEEKSISAVVCM